MTTPEVDLDYTPFRISSSIYYRGITVSACGIDKDIGLANTKAGSEMTERLYTSDLMNEDTEGLVTYLSANQWCSTGAAAHQTLAKSLEKSRCELIERDTVATWLALGSLPGQIVWQSAERSVVLIPCRFKNYTVAVCIRTQNDRQALSAGCSLCPSCAITSAYEESYLRTLLNDEFLARRLPVIQCGYDPVLSSGEDDLPESTRQREWIVGDLHVTKLWSPDMSDFYRGITAMSIDKYRAYVGREGSTWRRVKKSWLV